MLVGFRRAAGMAYKGGQIHCFNFAGQKQRRGLLCGGYTSNITEDMCVCVCEEYSVAKAWADICPCRGVSSMSALPNALVNPQAESLRMSQFGSEFRL